jgi:hypothetical protein
MNALAKCCVALAMSLASTSVVWAQTTDKACSQPERGNQTLSQKLGQTNGVICPPEVDPAIKAPTPNSGTMPVIPPPGSPGGNPNVQPK